MVVPLSIIVSNEVTTPCEELTLMLASEIFQNVGWDDAEEGEWELEEEVFTIV